jgi:hypothetical protein
MKKSTEAALSIGIAYLLMKFGLAVWRHPIVSTIAFTAVFVLYALDGAPFWEAVRSARSLAAIYGGIISQAWIECARNTCYYAEPSWYATTRALNGLYVSSLGDFHWWFHRDGWLPNPALITSVLLSIAIGLAIAIMFPHRSHDEKQLIRDEKRKARSHAADPPVE